MKIQAVSDLHGNLIDIEPCDLLLICGDISPLSIQRDPLEMWKWIFNDFYPWINQLNCTKVLFTPGNHDFWFQNEMNSIIKSALEDSTIPHSSDLDDYEPKLRILIDQSVNYFCNRTNESITVYGTPWCKKLSSDHLENREWAFTLDGGNLLDKYNQIPFNIDILMTHEAPMIGHVGSEDYMSHYGSILLTSVIESVGPKYAVCGHVHDGNHIPIKHNNTIVNNVSILNRNYKIEYKPFEFELKIEKEKDE